MTDRCQDCGGEAFRCAPGIGWLCLNCVAVRRRYADVRYADVRESRKAYCDEALDHFFLEHGCWPEDIGD